MVLRLAEFFMRLEARLSYALIGLVQATGYAGGLDYGISFRSFSGVYGDCVEQRVDVGGLGGNDGLEQ